jgi:divalent metal cation (Fe/Co/Zn/Cd) transporter
LTNTSIKRLYAIANQLAIITISYNIIEGVVSVWFGAADETLSLFGFGMDSFVEVISGVGIWHMVHRIKANGVETKDNFEQMALQITGWAFYMLTFVLVLSAIVSLYEQHKPGSTLWGIIVSLVSISCMWILIHYKTKVGNSLNSSAILADAACSKVCLYLSLVLLIASSGYELTGLRFFDSAGALLIAYLSYREGREAFQKSRGLSCCCHGDCEIKPS